MAKRLAPRALDLEPLRTDHPEVCGVCGGNVEIEENRLPASRYPRRYKCLNCDSEYGTTRPAERNY